MVFKTEYLCGHTFIIRKGEADGTRSYVGLDVSKDRLDVAVLGERQEQQVSNTEGGIVQLVKHIAIHGDGGILHRSTVRGFDVASPLM